MKQSLFITVVLLAIILPTLTHADPPDVVPHAVIYCDSMAPAQSESWTECVVSQYNAILSLQTIVHHAYSLNLTGLIDPIFWQCKADNTNDDNGINFTRVVQCVASEVEKAKGEAIEKLLKITPKQGA